jgi:hypothetical protein
MKGSSVQPNRRLTALMVVVLALPASLAAQDRSVAGARAALAPADARVVLMPAALYNEQANVQEASDAAQAAVATEVLTARLGELLGPRLVDAAEAARLAGSAEALATTGGLDCGVKVACARTVGRQANAAWVVMSKVSKTSNLIWLLTGQLIHVPSGEIVLDDSTELKGEPEAMTRIGARIFAERVARTVERGGIVTDYPDGEPAYVGPAGASE